jgi:hypothetical protein
MHWPCYAVALFIVLLLHTLNLTAKHISIVFWGSERNPPALQQPALLLLAS